MYLLSSNYIDHNRPNWSHYKVCYPGLELSILHERVDRKPCIYGPAHGDHLVAFLILDIGWVKMSLYKSVSCTKLALHLIALEFNYLLMMDNFLRLHPMTSKGSMSIKSGM